MSVSPFDHPFLSGLLGDEETAALFSVEADIDAMIAFEAALAVCEARAGVIPAQAGGKIERILAGFVPDMAALRMETARDGVVVPALVRQLRAAVGKTLANNLHFGATSQDVIDTSLALRLKQVAVVLDRRLGTVIALMDEIFIRDGAIETMAHTRMQAAILVPAARKIASWRDPLVRHRMRLADAAGDIAVLSFGGAAGTLEALGNKARDVTHRLAAHLDLAEIERPRHSERDNIAAFASCLCLVSGSLGKTGQDIALMVQNEIGEIKLARGGASSAMPHKVNPVGAETLVALARFNATLLSGVHQSMVHENERSGAAWTLEWMLLPQMVVAAAASLRTAEVLLRELSFVRRG